MNINLQDHSDGVRAGWVHFRSGNDTIRGYLAMPIDGDNLPILITAHENLGVTAHRQEVTRALAAEGFASLAVDLFSRLGGIPPQDYIDNDDRRSRAFLAARDDQAVPDLQAGLDFMKQLDETDATRAAALGFCLGGGTVMVWSTQTTDLRAVVSLYGIPVLPAEYSPTGIESSRIPLLSSITSPMQFHFGAEDEAIPREQIDELADALAGAAHPARLYRYEGAGHAYQDDTHPNYDKAAALLTWDRTMSFLRESLS